MKCFRSLEYIFKFIIQSRLLFARATGGQNEDSFRVDVDSLFESFAHMLNMHLDNIQASQVCLLLLYFTARVLNLRATGYFLGEGHGAIWNF